MESPGSFLSAEPEAGKRSALSSPGDSHALHTVQNAYLHVGGSANNSTFNFSFMILSLKFYFKCATVFPQ